MFVVSLKTSQNNKNMVSFCGEAAAVPTIDTWNNSPNNLRSAKKRWETSVCLPKTLSLLPVKRTDPRGERKLQSQRPTGKEGIFSPFKGRRGDGMDLDQITLNTACPIHPTPTPTSSAFFPHWH